MSRPGSAIGILRGLALLSAVSLAGCHDESPTKPRTLALSTSFPSAVSRGQEFSFGATLTNTSLLTQWEIGSLVYVIPTFSIEQPRITATNGFESGVSRASAESPGWEVVVGANPLRPGHQLWFTATATVAPDAAGEIITTQVFGTGFNSAANHLEENVYAADRVYIGAPPP
jgi:hypothetical protein